MRVSAIIIALFSLSWAEITWAESLVAARTLRSQSILTANDVAWSEKTVPGALQDPNQAIGMETRVVLYAGHPIRPGDLVPPALVERNALVALVFAQPGLQIRAEGRAMGRAGVGEMVRVMNLASRTTVSGVVRPDGTVQVGPIRSREGF